MQQLFPHFSKILFSLILPNEACVVGWFIFKSQLLELAHRYIESLFISGAFLRDYLLVLNFGSRSTFCHIQSLHIQARHSKNPWLVYTGNLVPTAPLNKCCVLATCKKQTKKNQLRIVCFASPKNLATRMSNLISHCLA